MNNIVTLVGNRQKLAAQECNRYIEECHGKDELCMAYFEGWQRADETNAKSWIPTKDNLALMASSMPIIVSTAHMSSHEVLLPYMLSAEELVAKANQYDYFMPIEIPA